MNPQPDRGAAARKFIPVYEPDLSGNERRYVLECLDTTWISSLGVFIEKFETAFKTATGGKHAASVSNGTVALHLAHHCLDIGPGDEVIVPTFTYIASVNTIAQTGAVPVFVECRPDDWLIDVDSVARAITPRTKAIVPVHLYGAVCDMPSLCELARHHGIAIVEDCAEALGSRLNGQHVGTFGDIGTFSFFGNKTVTTGEGGMVITNDSELAERLRRVKGQGQSAHQRYWHIEMGFNYRMTNICAALGLAQMERLNSILARKQAIGELYRRSMEDLPVSFQKPLPGVTSSDWLVSLLLPKGADSETVMSGMRASGIETRPVFRCAHKMPMYDRGQSFAISEDISSRGISLPSYPGLSDDDVLHVVDTLRYVLANGAPRRSSHSVAR
jgi:perosamine synthetase